MNGLDAISVIPILMLFVLLVAYAILAFYIGVVVASHTCKVCGMSLSGDEAYREHMEEHVAGVVEFPADKGTVDTDHAA